MKQTVSRSRSRKVNGYVKAVLALEAVRRRRQERYDRFVRRWTEIATSWRWKSRRGRGR